MAWLERASFISTTYNETVDGQGNTVQFLVNWPVTAVNSVMINGNVIQYIPNQEAPFAPSYGFYNYGYTWREWDGTVPGNPGAIQLLGGTLFTWGYQNVIINYRAGYTATEYFTLPGSGTDLFNVQMNMPQGICISDGGVTYYNFSTSTVGSTFTYVPWPAGGSSELVLTAGQYSIDPANVGSYYFSLADTGQGIAVSYSFVPYAVEQACWEWINDIYARKTRPGVKSKSLASQETMSYDTSAVPSYVAMALQPFRSVIPL
jgi:hypothetical protein